MHKRLTKNLRCFFSSDPSIRQQNQNYFDFLDENLQSLQIVQSKTRAKLGPKVYVPFRPQSRSEVVKFFEQNNLREKNMIMDVDSSHLLGLRRVLVLQHLKKNVYKDVEQPIEILSASNPEFESGIDELYFDDDLFFMTDPKFVHLWDTNKTDEQVDSVIQEYYDNHIDRGVERLKEQFKLPAQFLYLIETAHNFDNKIYFGGINQYDFRNVVWLYHTIDELKSFFIRALGYWKNSDSFLKSEDTIDMVEFNQKCRQFLTQETYYLIQPFKYQKLKLLRSKIPNSYCFAHSYAFKKKTLESINIQFGKQHGKATQSDKIEKHAILEVMLGNLWNQPYSKNKFPHLSESFLKLSEADQETITGIFNKHCNIYLTAIEKFRDRHFKQTEGKSKLVN